jgi:hypothetical protein
LPHSATLALTLHPSTHLPACLPAAGCGAASDRRLLCSRGAGAGVQLPAHLQAGLWPGWCRLCNGVCPCQHAPHAVCLPGVAGAAAAGHSRADLARMVGGTALCCDVLSWQAALAVCWHGGAWRGRAGQGRPCVLLQARQLRLWGLALLWIKPCPPAALPACLPLHRPACRSRDCVKGLGAYYKLAVPSTLMVCLEWWAYEFCIFMAGWLPNPTLSVASVGVMLQVSGFCYMLPMVRTARFMLRSCCISCIARDAANGRSRLGLACLLVAATPAYQPANQPCPSCRACPAGPVVRGVCACQAMRWGPTCHMQPAAAPTRPQPSQPAPKRL